MMCIKDADVAEELADTSHQMVCSVYFGGQTFLPISRACKKQTAVSHSSTEAEVILDIGLRIEELLAPTLWDIVFDVLEPSVFRAGGDLPRQPKPKSIHAHTGIPLTICHQTHQILQIVLICLWLRTTRL